MIIKAKDKPEKKESFEEALEKLEGIVRDLESGDKGLEESLKLFKEGSNLSKNLTRRLEDVKNKVEVLVKEGKSFKAHPLDDEKEAED